jgi:hypothetical protein
MRVEYNINKVQDKSSPLAQYGLLDVHSPVAPGLTKATQTVGDADPEAKDEGCALVKHSAGEVEGYHRILRWMLDEHPYLARQLSVFYRHVHRGKPPRW